MSSDMDNMIKKFSEMMNSGSFPNHLKESLNNINKDSGTSKDSSTGTKETSSSGFDPSKISPEMLNAFATMMNNASSSSNNDSKEKSGIDFEMIMKMKTIMEKMNSKDDPRSNLLLSLKPYLKDSRKNKVEQYINIFNMTKVMDIFNNTGGGKSK
jgi:hypothetical protein